ncbi:hypothetical protein OS493_024328 [Desmophyllum pertusum]|uniref:Mind bomb SH3 repeat domain-containing protein n=1 Tax=Desmophyllum pertusum TaxID=174260 RepID=A0A9W9YPU9_9CNID|nr:hypothetical protein OS493_024328 [Desmophyllum pertusum]
MTVDSYKLIKMNAINCIECPGRVFKEDMLNEISNLLTIPTFQTGDKVRVLNDKQLVQNLQQEHGWNESMAVALGKQGMILAVNTDGNAVVKVGTDQWLFNPAALEATSQRGETESPAISFEHQAARLIVSEGMKDIEETSQATTGEPTQPTNNSQPIKNQGSKNKNSR